MKTRKLWLGFIAVLTISFAILLYFGREIYRQAPPIPVKVVTTDGTVIFTEQAIKDGLVRQLTSYLYKNKTCF